MCGAFAIRRGETLEDVANRLGVIGLEGRGLRLPTQPIQVIAEPGLRRTVIDATWWLFLDDHGKPVRYRASFNSRWDKLHTSRLTKGPYRRSRCLIPATSFVEGQGGRYHELARPGHAIAFGGLLRTIEVDGEPVHSASIITCPGNPKLDKIHRASLPLMIPVDDSEAVSDWLDPDITDTDRFEHWLTGRLPHELTAQPIAGARNFETAGAAQTLAAD